MSYLIGEAARKVGVSASALRLWERQGLLRPARRGSYRLYTDADLEHLHSVRRLRQVDQLNAPGIRRVLRDAVSTSAHDRRIDGRPLRRLRQELGLSLREASERTGLSVSFLSSLERGASGASIATLQRLTAAYGTTLNRVFGAPAAPGGARLVPAGQGLVLRLGEPSVRIEQLARHATHLEPQLFVLAPGATSEGAYAHEGEEFMYLLSGALTVWLGDSERYRLDRTGRCPHLPLDHAAPVAQRRRGGDPTAVDQHATDVLTDWAGLTGGVAPVWARYTDLVVERASGAWLETVDGERYLDYTSGIGVTNTGHAHPRVAAAVSEQVARGIHLQQNVVYHRPGLELHRRLPARFPNPAPGTDYGLFLSNSGAEAVEAAVKLAKYVTRRPNVIAFRGGFHGRTHGAMALTSSSVKYRAHYEPLMGGVHFVPYPYPLRMGGAEAALGTTLEAIDELFATLAAPDDVACFIVEPVLGEGGYVVPPDGFLPALREIATRHGILLAVDEIQSGYARTGRFFATEWTDATPDIVIMAKGIASGLPLSGILAPRALLDQLAPGVHGGTFGGNVVACAAALATLDVIDDERLADRAQRLGDRILAGLSQAATGHSHVAEVRGRGMMIAIELADPGTLAPRADLVKRLLAETLARNLLLLSCGTRGQVVRIIPPLITTDDEVDTAVGIISEALATLGD